MATLRTWLRSLPRSLLERFLEGQRYLAIEEGVTPTLWMAPRRRDDGRVREVPGRDEVESADTPPGGEPRC